MRHAYLGVKSSLSGDERTNVLQVTSSAEHVFSLLAELTQEYQKSSTNASLNGADWQALAVAPGLPAAGGGTAPVRERPATRTPA